MTQRDRDRPSWVSPVVHAGLGLTIGCVILAQFVTGGWVELALIGLALVGIGLSLVPIIAQDPNAWWQLLRGTGDEVDNDCHHSTARGPSAEREPSRTGGTDMDPDD